VFAMEGHPKSAWGKASRMLSVPPRTISLVPTLKPPDESADQRRGNNANTFDQTELCDAETLPNCFECNGCRSAAMAVRDASRVRVGHGHPASPSPRPAASAARWPASSTRPAFAALQRPG